MSVLDRATLEASPLADLHALASELGIDGFRRLRKAELVDALLAQGGGGEDRAASPRRRSRRGRAAAGGDEETAAALGHREMALSAVQATDARAVAGLGD